MKACHQYVALPMKSHLQDTMSVALQTAPKLRRSTDDHCCLIVGYSSKQMLLDLQQVIVIQIQLHSICPRTYLGVAMCLQNPEEDTVSNHPLMEYLQQISTEAWFLSHRSIVRPQCDSPAAVVSTTGHI